VTGGRASCPGFRVNQAPSGELIVDKREVVSERFSELPLKLAGRVCGAFRLHGPRRDSGPTALVSRLGAAPRRGSGKAVRRVGGARHRGGCEAPTPSPALSARPAAGRGGPAAPGPALWTAARRAARQGSQSSSVSRADERAGGSRVGSSLTMRLRSQLILPTAVSRGGVPKPARRSMSATAKDCAYFRTSAPR
jgi:hypothetical protein